MPEELQNLNCPQHTKKTPMLYYTDYTKRDYYISLEDIRNKYLPLGFNKFKISGRSNSIATRINTIEVYTKYFIKPEYQDEFRNNITIRFLKKIIDNKDYLYL